MSHFPGARLASPFPRVRAAAAITLVIGIAAACAAPPTAPRESKQPTSLRADETAPPIPQDSTSRSGYQNPGGK